MMTSSDMSERNQRDHLIGQRRCPPRCYSHAHVETPATNENDWPGVLLTLMFISAAGLGLALYGGQLF
jgi:hypothetical protein